MLDSDTEQHWSAVKESYPDAVVFHEHRGIFIVKGRDTEVLAKEFGIDSDSRWYGFDPELVCAYMTELAARGYSVVKASVGRVAHVRPPADRRAEISRQRKSGRFLAVAPTLLFDQGEIDRSANDRWLQQRGYEELFDRFKRWLLDDDLRSLRTCGEPYIYPVGEWYELDGDLTSMLDGHVLLLAKAALATGLKMPCKLVEPPSRRKRTRKNSTPTSRPEGPAQHLGQMRFEGF